MGKPDEEITYMKSMKEVEDEEEIEKGIYLATRKYNPEEGTVDLGHQTCTNMKTSRRIIFPPARTAKEEATLEVRLEMWKEKFKNYMKENCKDNCGEQKTEQLTHQQDRGKMKVIRRVRKGEIHVSPSDKGKSVVVMPMAMYQKMVQTHTSKDKEVNWARLEEAQKLVRSHTRSLAKIFKIGTNRGERNQTRCHANLSSWACDPPVLRATAKTHKPPDGQGLPKSRPIVGAARGLTTPLGETLSDLIEPVAKARSKQWEAQSTEEVLRMIEETR